MADAFSELSPLTIVLSVVVCLFVLFSVAYARWVATKQLERFGCVLYALGLFVSLLQRFFVPELPQAKSVGYFMAFVGFFVFVVSHRQAAKRAS
jgi:hypothetical protein